MTFAYTDADITRITGLIGQSDNFLNQPDITTDFKELEKMKWKQIAYELHAETLGEYVKIKRIPHGLRSNLRPTMFSKNEQFCQKWEAILNKCSIDLMVAIIEETQRITQSVAKCCREGKSKMTAHLQDFRMEVQARKRHKFQRDATDYEEGTRNDYGSNMRRYPQGPRNKPMEPRKPRASSAASDSQDISLSFLGDTSEGAANITKDKQPREYKRCRMRY
ncbi:hypothetical protein XELAEV_18014976mg [Xenopus laevis]|uniref:Uncharacterized protein n=1 Tax=Xenopus laevis TaxID=8355 RepID=A0A974DH52_XENLA|nr:hypothetical protein XELAEV_18014976mg [Xenopus laevis]